MLNSFSDTHSPSDLFPKQMAVNLGRIRVWQASRRLRGWWHGLSLCCTHAYPGYHCSHHELDDSSLRLAFDGDDRRDRQDFLNTTLGFESDLARNDLRRIVAARRVAWCRVRESSKVQALDTHWALGNDFHHRDEHHLSLAEIIAQNNDIDRSRLQSRRKGRIPIHKRDSICARHIQLDTYSCHYQHFHQEYKI